MLIIFLLGACIGSFLNVVILRYLENSSLGGRSHCPACGGQLRWWELVPIFSFILLRGRCHRCHSEISVQYPLVEAVMGGVTMILLAPLPSTLVGGTLTLLEIIMAALLVVLFVIDLKTMLLPDLFVGLLLGCALVREGIVYYLSSNMYHLSNPLGGIVVGAGFLLFLWLITRGRGIGLGDVKLMIPLGIWSGLVGTLTLLFIAYMAGGGVAFYLLSRRRATLKTAMPFGPFLSAAALLLLLIPSIPEKFLILLLGYNPLG